MHFLHRYLENEYLCGFAHQKWGPKIPELQSKVKKIDTGGEVLCIQKRFYGDKNSWDFDTCWICVCRRNADFFESNICAIEITDMLICSSGRRKIL